MILITGINGEMGNALIKKLYSLGINNIVGLDIKSANKNIKPLLYKNYIVDIKNNVLIERIFKENQISTIYHLAAILSTKSELNPFIAHQINVDGFLNLINQIKLYGVANFKYKMDVLFLFFGINKWIGMENSNRRILGKF